MRALRAPTAFEGERFMSGGATVFVEDSVIKGVESVGYEVPADCSLTTFNGTVLPGLFDAHVHLVSDASPGSLERAGSLDAYAIDDIIVQVVRHSMPLGGGAVPRIPGGPVSWSSLPHRTQRRK